MFGNNRPNDSVFIDIPPDPELEHVYYIINFNGYSLIIKRLLNVFNIFFE